jgi:uncharacterized membrane protein
MHDPSNNTVATTRQFTAAWACYALFAVSIFLWWPALIAVLICYVKKGEPNAGIVDSHYRWLIATFWWWLLLLVVCLAVIIAGAGPIVRDVLEAVHASGGDWDNVAMKLNIDWSSIFIAVAVAALGLFSLLFLWFWLIYRVVRGGLRLADGCAVP